jgi:hypothetical protein
MGLEQVTRSSLELSFRKHYMGYEELTRILEGWATAHPDFVRLRSLAKTEGQRDLWLVEIGRDPDRLRPAICIDANMHSTELLGTNAALTIAQTLIGLHNSREPGPALPRALQQAALDGLYYIIPRVSPDGAEEIVTARRVSRSAPRQRRGKGARPHWVRRDMDRDGRIRQLRIKHPAGEFVSHPQYAHVLVPRTIDDDGPYFKVFPEGFIEDYDGAGIPFPDTLSDNDSDFNRNFPFGWSAEREGAGHFPGWEPETNGIVEFATRAPHIFAWLNLHTFGGVFIRPPFSNPTHEVALADLKLYAYAAEIAAAYTRMPTIGALEDMTPESTQPMTGTLASWAYGDRGCLAWAIELWDLFAAAGLSKQTPFWLNYTIQGRKEIDALVKWDTHQNGGRVFSQWQAFRHPQLGDVEIGGIDAIHGFINPPEREIDAICHSLSSFALALMSLRPHLDSRVAVESISGSLTKVSLFACNSGYLPTYVTAESRTRPWNSGLNVLVEPSGCTLVSGQSSTEVGHLPGWGRGVNEEANAPFFQKSRGVHDIIRTWIVEGQGELRIEIGAPRVGWHYHTLLVGQ